MILGTVQYMAPEQLEGRQADERTDIFAFGVVLYEMVTGRRAFEGPSTVALIGNILHADPPSPSSIAPLTPPVLDEVVRLCLGKDPAARYQSMTDVQSRLTAARNLAVRAPVKPVGGRWRAPVAAVLLAGTVGGLVWREWTRSQFQNPPPERVAVQRKLTRLTFDQGLQTEPTFSPDGRFIVYASDRLGNFDIWVQPLAGGEPVQITRSPEPDTQPSWSPDGGTIVFRSERDGGGLYVVPALGGDDRRLTKDGDHPTWSPDGKHVRYLTSSFEQAHKTLKEVSVEDGATQLLFPEFTEGGGWDWIAPHPDGRFSFLGFKPKLGLGFFTVSNEGTVISSDVKRHLPAQLARFTDGTWDTYGRRFCWNRTGTALFLETQAVGTISNLWKIGVDPKTLDWVSFERLTTGPGADVRAALTPDGEHLAFSTLNESIRLYQFPFTADNKLTEGRPLTQEGAAVSYASVAPDGKSAVYNLGRFGVADPATLWHSRLDSASSRQLGTDGSNARLSPDGRQVAYSKISADRTVGFAAVMVRSVDGGPERSLMPWQKAWVAANDWISDGTAVLVSNRALETWPVTTSPAKSLSRVVLAVPNAGLFQAKYSPNGRWLSFVVAHDSGGAQIGVASVDGVPDRKWIAIETDQPWADKPRWSTDGKRLYFLAGEGSFLNLWAIAFDAERGIPIGVPFPVARFTSPALRIDPRVSFTEMDVSSRGVFLTMQSSRGNIWMLDNVDK